jgi:hypothetical protein
MIALASVPPADFAQFAARLASAALFSASSSRALPASSPQLVMAPPSQASWLVRWEAESVRLARLMRRLEFSPLFIYFCFTKKWTWGLPPPGLDNLFLGKKWPDVRFFFASITDLSPKLQDTLGKGVRVAAPACHSLVFGSLHLCCYFSVWICFWHSLCGIDIYGTYVYDTHGEHVTRRGPAAKQHQTQGVRFRWSSTGPK